MANVATASGVPNVIELTAPAAGVIQNAIINAVPGSTIHVLSKGANQKITLAGVNKPDPVVKVKMPLDQVVYGLFTNCPSLNVDFEGGSWESDWDLPGGETSYAITADYAHKFAIRGARVGLSKNQFVFANCDDTIIENVRANHPRQDMTTVKSPRRHVFRNNRGQEFCLGYKMGVYPDGTYPLYGVGKAATRTNIGIMTNTGEGTLWSWYDSRHGDVHQLTVSAPSARLVAEDVVVEYNDFECESQGYVVYDSTPAYAPIRRFRYNYNKLRTSQVGGLSVRGTHGEIIGNEILQHPTAVEQLVAGIFAQSEVFEDGLIRGGQNIDQNVVKTNPAGVDLYSGTVNGPVVDPVLETLLRFLPWEGSEVPAIPPVVDFGVMLPEIVEGPVIRKVGAAAAVAGTWLSASRGIGRVNGGTIDAWEYRWKLNGIEDANIVATVPVYQAVAAGNIIYQEVRMHTQHGWSNWSRSAPITIV